MTDYEQERDEILDDLSVAVYKAKPDTIDNLMKDAKKRFDALVQREVRKGKVEELATIKRLFGGLNLWSTNPDHEYHLDERIEELNKETS